MPINAMFKSNFSIHAGIFEIASGYFLDSKRTT